MATFNNPSFYTSPSAGGMSRNQEYANRLRQQFAANDARQAAARAEAQAAAGAEEDRIAKGREEAYGLARGRVGELRNDPVDQEVLAALRGRATGQDIPYNDTMINALFGQQAEMNAQSQRNELDRIRTGGGSITDPAVQAQLRAAQARSDASMQRARMGVDTQANLVNYDARGQALGQTGAFNQLRNQGITSAEDRLLGLLSQEVATSRQASNVAQPQMSWTTTTSSGQPRTSGSTRSPDFAAPVYRAGQIYGQRPAQPQAAPQTQPQQPPLVPTYRPPATSGGYQTTSGQQQVAFDPRYQPVSQTPQRMVRTMLPD